MAENDGKYELPVVYDELEWWQKKEVRNQYIKEQNNKCFLCNNSLDREPPKHIRDLEIDWDLFPENFLKYPVHLQHDHQTGLTEGAIHSYCNAVLWQYYGR